MDRRIDQSTINRKRNGRYLRWGLIAAGDFVSVWLGLRMLRPSADEDTLRFAIVERGEVKNTINATALVLAAFKEQVNAWPYRRWSNRFRRRRPAGTGDRECPDQCAAEHR